MTDTSAEHVLETALARVAALEKAIAEHGRPPPRRSSLPLYLLLAVAGCAIAIVAAASVLRPTPMLRALPPEKRPLPADGELALAPPALFSRSGPLFVDVNGDGAKDLVVLGWHEVREDEPAYVAVLDRVTYKALWRAGPFAARPRDQRLTIKHDALDGAIVVSDARTTTSLGAAHGDARGAQPAELPQIDPFPPRPSPPCPPDRDTPCMIHADDGVEQVLAKAIGARHVFASTLTGNGAQVQVASVIMPNDESLWYAAQLSSDGGVRWVTPVLSRAMQRKVDMYARTSPNEWSTVARGRLLHVYQLAKGPYRMVARDLRTGAQEYDVQLGDLAQGAFLEWLSADQDDAFLVADGELYVIDAKTGAITRRIRHF